MTTKRLIHDWAPAVLWAAVILAASNQSFSAEHTDTWVHENFTRFSGLPLSEETLEIINFVVRKLSHLTEYGIFSALTFRALRGDREGWSSRWAIPAIVLSVALAAIDEFHQTFVPGRTGVVADVLIDGCGATIAQLLTRHL